METNEKMLSAIFNLGRLIKENIRCKICSTNFTQTEIEVLKFAQNRKSLRMRDIADYLHIKPSSATPLIDSLVKKGYLKREKPGKDRRVIGVIMTKKGQKSIEKIEKIVHGSIQKIFKKLKESDKQNLIKILNKLNDENL